MDPTTAIIAVVATLLVLGISFLVKKYLKKDLTEEQKEKAEGIIKRILTKLVSKFKKKK